ncbi:short chain dehydrogenase [Acrodontium crateriforme]|uniref:Short chain dehydrogenase n=1 Tax=Acrodontium crateriforme TaxID=150365 RepID=A0AAQ3MA78_9PEZI|nr:short chain dehydrogenase [Acrodontium crateriforme]
MSFIYSQLIQSLPCPSESYDGKTVIVSGSNVGLGKEAARHFTRLNASKVILAVRSLEKGSAAKEDILGTTGKPNKTVEVWQLDMASYSSVKQFAARCKKELDRIDIFIANAGIATDKFKLAEDNESTITVNVVSTMLLALLVLPQLKATAKKFNTKPTLTITSSEVHAWTKFRERSAPEGGIFDALNAPDTNMAERYMTSKLLEVFAVRAIAEKHSVESLGGVTMNFVNPGLCHSELGREAGWGLYLLKMALARTTEYGSRTLVHAGTSGADTHGQYMSDCHIEPVVAWVRDTDDGNKTQARVWDELSKKLEKIQPGILNNL